MTSQTPPVSFQGPFSLLLPVWRGDHPDALELAFTSTVIEQERRPAQVVMTIDGPIGADLAEMIASLVDHARDTGITVNIERWDRTVGLGPALNRGLAVCRHEVIARIDADDYSDPTRFAVQLELIADGADVVGSAIGEFVDDPQEVSQVRTPPLTDAAIKKGMAFRQTVFHPSVVFRRSVVQSVGAYPDLPGMEDYLLFARLVAAGASMTNTPAVLVKYRVGRGAYRRRGGWRMIKTEVRMQRELWALGLVGIPGLVRNLGVRLSYRLLPTPARRWGYRLWIRRSNGRSLSSDIHSER